MRILSKMDYKIQHSNTPKRMVCCRKIPDFNYYPRKRPKEMQVMWCSCFEEKFLKTSKKLREKAHENKQHYGEWSFSGSNRLLSAIDPEKKISSARKFGIDSSGINSNLSPRSWEGKIHPKSFQTWKVWDMIYPY